METSVVRQRVREAIERAKRPAADRRGNRRAQMDEAARQYELFLERIAVPLFKQVGNVLVTEGYPFKVFTPGGSVRLMSERVADDYLEVVFDTNSAAPKLLARASSSRGGNVTESELVLNATADISELTEEDVLGFVLSELEGFV